MGSDKRADKRHPGERRDPPVARVDPGFRRGDVSTGHFFSGSSFFLSLPSMYGLHGFAFTGAGVFHTTLNWPSAFTSPMNTGLCRWWFFASIVDVKPPGARKVWPAIAAITLSVSVLSAFSTASFHMWMPM